MKKKILEEVQTELTRAKTKFPQWPSDPFHAVAILNEEVGELNKALLEYVYEPEKCTGYVSIVSESIQVAAMALRFLESIYFMKYELEKGNWHNQE